MIKTVMLKNLFLIVSDSLLSEDILTRILNLLSFLDSGLLDHSAEISEIDARPNALQEFMKRSMETAKSTAKR